MFARVQYLTIISLFPALKGAFRLTRKDETRIRILQAYNAALKFHNILPDLKKMKYLFQIQNRRIRACQTSGVDFINFLWP